MRRCVFDIEGNGLINQVTSIWCMVFMDIDTQEVFKFRPNELQEAIAFMDNCKMLACHNSIMYDFPAIEKVLDYQYKGERVDTYLMSMLLFPERNRHGLAVWGEEMGIPKPEHEDWTQFSEDMLHRCVEDVRITLGVYKACLRKLTHLKQLGVPFPKKAFDLTFAFFEILGRQERSGWKFDVRRGRRYVRQLTKWIRWIDETLERHLPIVYDVFGDYVKKPFLKDGTYSSMTTKWYPDAEDTKIVAGQFTRLTFRRLDLGKPNEVKDFLIKSGWQPKEYNTKDGVNTSPKLNGTDPFIGINGGVGRLIARRLQCVQRRSIIEGWLAKVRPDGRLSQEINGLCDTRRIKHSVLVNVPSAEAFFGAQMRKLFVAKEGYSLVGTDASGCQDRMLLGRANTLGFEDPQFEDMLLRGDKDKGTDSHTRAMKAINPVLVKHNLKPISRKIAKNFNFAYKFACGDAKLGNMSNAPKAKEYKVGEDVRSALNNLFLAQFQTSEWLKECWRQTASTIWNDKYSRMEKGGGYILSLEGAPVRVPKEKDCLVYALQNDEAVMMQYAILFYDKWCKQLGWVYGEDYSYVGVAHDEFTTEVKDELAETSRQLAEKAIAKAGEYLKIPVPHIGEGMIGKNWLEIH